MLPGNDIDHIRIKRSYFKRIWANRILNSSYILLHLFLGKLQVFPSPSLASRSQCLRPTSNLETLQEAGTEIAFQWVRFHAEQETGAQRWIGRPCLSANEMWWTSEFYWHAAEELATAAGAQSPNPVFLGWELDPGCSVRNDTYLLEARV